MLSKKVMLFGSALISGLLLVWLVAMAFAHDQGVYMSQASRGHSLVATPFFVHVYASKAWALGNDNDPVRWAVEDVNLRPLVHQALVRWTHEFPDLHFLETSSTSTAHVIFEEKSCGSPAVKGHARFPLAGWYTDATRTARYWENEVDICLNINTNWVDDDHKVNALGHEVGLLYGLNDQYNHNTNACNPTENTVMDGDSGTGPCDSGYPTDSDATRVAQYFEYGGFVEFSTTIRQNAATVSWSDDAWAEKDHVTWAAYRLIPFQADVGMKELVGV